METKKFNPKENKIAILIILFSSMFLFFHLLTGTKSISKQKELKKRIEIKRIMTEYEVNASEAETRYYDKYPNEKPNDYESR